jgi:glutathione S-transferase
VTTLYVIPGSHPSRAVTMMLDRKGVEYRRIDLVPVLSKGVVRVAGFPGVTVPALKIDGRKVQGSREIARELDRLYPEPPLLPARPAAASIGRGGRGVGRAGPAAGRAAGVLERTAA